MINVLLKGRLGNNLFQYAVGRHLALKNNTNLSLNYDYYINRGNRFGRRMRNLLSNFNIEPVLYKRAGLKVVLKTVGINWPFGNKNIYTDKENGFFPEVLMLGNGTTLKGYFQSEKYFKDIEEVIRNDLRIDSSTFGNENEYYEDQILSKNSVSMHVRRGDYLKSNIRNICDIKYFVKSVEYMQKNLKSPHFFVFSDDIEWCEK